MPPLLTVSADHLDASVELADLVAAVRAEADSFVFLSGGASGMSEETNAQLVRLLGALSSLSRSGLRLAVGDGGTRAGIMEASGLARRASGNAFPLIGISPAPEITATAEAGRTPVDPNHSHIVAVQNPSWERERRAEGWTPKDGYWGSETGAMYRVFERLADGRPSVTLVANGGAIVLDEMRANIAAGRPVILVSGSGRATDAVVSLLQGTVPSDPDVRQLRARAQEMGLPGPNPELCHVFEMSAGPDALARVLRELLEA